MEHNTSQVAQMNQSVINQWLKSVGIFLLIFIDVNYLLTTRFGRLKGNERYEAMWYLFILISIIVLPIFLGKVLNYFSSILSKIINNWQVTNQSRNLEFLISWGQRLSESFVEVWIRVKAEKATSIKHLSQILGL